MQFSDYTEFDSVKNRAKKLAVDPSCQESLQKIDDILDKSGLTEDEHARKRDFILRAAAVAYDTGYGLVHSEIGWKPHRPYAEEFLHQQNVPTRQAYLASHPKIGPQVQMQLKDAIYDLALTGYSMGRKSSMSPKDWEKEKQTFAGLPDVNGNYYRRR